MYVSDLLTTPVSNPDSYSEAGFNDQISVCAVVITISG